MIFLVLLSHCRLQSQRQKFNFQQLENYLYCCLDSTLICKFLFQLLFITFIYQTSYNLLVLYNNAIIIQYTYCCTVCIQCSSLILLNCFALVALLTRRAICTQDIRQYRLYSYMNYFCKHYIITLIEQSQYFNVYYEPLRNKKKEYKITILLS